MSFGCAARKPGEAIQPGLNVYSPQQDIQLGQQAASEIRKQVDIVDNPRLQEYISRVGQKISSVQLAGDYPYSFTLINDDSINAFALPGGPIFVNSGLLEAAGNEAQVAGVLAHEVSHVALRHATNQASKANLIQIPAILAGAALGNGSMAAQLGQLGIGLGVNSVLLKYSRDAERQADALGAKLMSQAGYDPLQMAEFFHTLEAEGSPRAPEFLSSHPDPGNRVDAVQAEVRTFPNQAYTARTGQFGQMKQLAAALPPPRKPQQQAASFAPSSSNTVNFRTLDANAFRLAYPAGWEVFGDRSSAVVTIAPREALVRNSRGAMSIGYGAVLSYYRPEEGRVQLEQSTNELIRQLASVNNSFRATGERRRVTVGGKQGLLTKLTSASPYGRAETDILLTVVRPRGLFYMVFVGPTNQFAQLDGVYDQMIESIRFPG